jgi:hypothetical protein
VDPGLRQVELDTPDGRKILSAGGDLRGLPADAAARKKLIAVGANYAFVLVPEASDFVARQAHVEVYSGLRQFRHGESPADARGYKTFPYAHYTGAVLGLLWVNDQPLELTPQSAALEGPGRAFKITTKWSAEGQLESVELEDAKGGKSGALPAVGRKSINLLAGAGMALASTLARVGAAPLAEQHALWSRREAERSKAAAPGAPATPVARVADASPTSTAHIRPALFWICAAAVLALIIGFVLGRAH